MAPHRASLRSRFWGLALRRTVRDGGLDLAGYRDRAAGMAAFAKRSARPGELETIDIGGIRAAWIRPPCSGDGKTLLHLHGGGYVAGDIESQLMMCLPMARSLGMPLLLPEYRLAPEHPFPAALEDALAAYRWLLAGGLDAKDIVLSGDSAGGGLALALALSLRDSGEPLPAAISCFSPWTDLANRGKSHVDKARAEVLLTTRVLGEWAACYSGGADLDNPLISPACADLRGLPPLLVQVGSEEILLDDSLALAEKARAAGLDVSLEVMEGLWHDWPALGNLVPESRLAFLAMGRFLLSRN
jgi:acetyl esterase/lipase